MINTGKQGELVQMLLDAGFANGWSLSGETLVQWEHDSEPPAPLTRPEATNETPTAD
jgi:hypothetical protein